MGPYICVYESTVNRSHWVNPIITYYIFIRIFNKYHEW